MSEQKIDRAVKFVEGMLARAADYHQHKESAAYAGITLFAAAVCTAVISEGWPPKWGSYSTALAVLASTLVWVVVLAFLRFQLTRRRWAAMRVGACERLLAAWIQEVPPVVDLALRMPNKGDRKAISLCDTVKNWLWGNANAVHAVDLNESVYPKALVDALLDQEKRPTGALQHERIILLSGWALYIILIVTALLRYCPGVAA